MDALLQLTRFVSGELAQKRLPSDNDPAFNALVDAVGNGRLRRLFDFCGDVGRDVALLALTAYLEPDDAVDPADATVETAAAFYPELIPYGEQRGCYERLGFVFATPGDPLVPFFRRACIADERLVGWLCGDDRPDGRLREGCGRVTRPGGALQPLFTGEPALGALTDVFRAGRSAQLIAPAGRGRRLLARHAAAQAGRALVTADAGPLLDDTRAGREKCAVLLAREAVLNDAAVCLSGFTLERAERDGFGAALRQCLRPLKSLARAGVPVVFCCDPGVELIPQLPGWDYIERVELPAFNRVQRIALWSGYAAQSGLGDAFDAADAGSRYLLDAGQIRSVTQRLAHLPPDSRGPRALAGACSAVLPQPAQGSIRRVETKLTLDDLKLPPDQKETLLSVCAHVQYRHKVYDEWGLDARYPYGRNVSLLMVGPPGTGKTMAAHVLSGMIGLPLYQINLSQVVDKYIGETEKRLEIIFDTAEKSNVILFFDEADSIFGKRSEVNDAKDKYANTEVSYILQRIEQYEGIVLLASNYKKNIDEAFMRRIRYMIEFQMPSREIRREVWRACFAPETPVSGIDFEYLARQFELSGGSIKNAALNAAFRAARDGSPVTMPLLLDAVRNENLKMGRTMIEQDFAEYAYLMRAQR